MMKSNCCHGCSVICDEIKKRHGNFVMDQGISCSVSWRRHPRDRNGRLRPLNSPRAWRMCLSAKKYTRRMNHYHRELYIFIECIYSAHDEFSQKNFTFSSSNFFLDPHTLVQCTCSKLAPFCLCLLHLTISLLSLYLFLIRLIWTASV
jgi:hypothetical protein